MRYIFLTVALLSVMLLANCSDANGPGPQNVIRENGKVFVVDQTGKRWEVTHAESEYGLIADNFQFGLGPNAIPPINNPKFFSPGMAGYPDSNATFLILGTEINGESRAYPIDVLSRHEVAIENFGDTHVTVAYWPLVQLAAVYSRVIDGEVLTFAASGWTYQNTFILYDHQTESIWYHLEGEEEMTCVDGFYKDRKLPELTSAFTRWNNWQAEFPNTKFLAYP